MTAATMSRAAADNARRRAKRAAEAAARNQRRTELVAESVADAVRRIRREVRVVRLPGGKVYGLGAYAGTDHAHPFVPDDGGTGTTCQLCFGWSNDYRHTSTVMAAS